MVKREDTGRLAQIEIEGEKQVLNLLELSRSPLKFDEDAILCMHREDHDVSEVTNLNEIANAQTIWIVKEKIINESTKEGEHTAHTKNGGASKFMKHSSGHAREPTEQEKLLKIQAISNETKQGEGKSKGYEI